MQGKSFLCFLLGDHLEFYRLASYLSHPGILVAQLGSIVIFVSALYCVLADLGDFIPFVQQKGPLRVNRCTRLETNEAVLCRIRDFYRWKGKPNLEGGVTLR